MCKVHNGMLFLPFWYGYLHQPEDFLMIIVMVHIPAICYTVWFVIFCRPWPDVDPMHVTQTTTKSSQK